MARAPQGRYAPGSRATQVADAGSQGIPMHRSAPPPLQRLRQRLLNRDAAGLVAERIETRNLRALVKWLGKPQRRKYSPIGQHAPLFAHLLADIEAVARRSVPSPPGQLLRAAFAAGIIAGCHLRDEAERDQPMCCTLRLDDAIRSMDASDISSTLWAIGLPDDLQDLLALVRTLDRLVPDLGSRFQAATELAPARRRGPLSAVAEVHFLLGMLAAGITLPR